MTAATLSDDSTAQDADSNAEDASTLARDVEKGAVLGDIAIGDGTKPVDVAPLFVGM